MYSPEPEVINERRSTITSTDSDTEFLLSLRDDVKALSPQLKLRFKCEVLQLLEKLRYPSPSAPLTNSCKHFAPSPDSDHDSQISSRYHHSSHSQSDRHYHSSSPILFPQQSLKSLRKSRKQTRTTRSQTPHSEAE